MALPGCKILVSAEPPTAIIKIAGRAAAESAREFQLLVQRLHGDGTACFCLDLTGCLLMDSTFSGVLAGLAGEPGTKAAPNRPQFTLVGANARVLDLLDNLGVLGLVQVLTGGELLAGREGGAEIALGEVTKDDTTRCCLEAHRLLMQLKPENAAKFRPVVELIERQLTP